MAPQDGNPSEEDLQRWGHHSSASTVPDAVMQRAAGDDVSFVFTCKVDGKVPELPCGPGSGGASGSGGQHLGSGSAGLRGVAGRLGGGRHGATVTMATGEGAAPPALQCLPPATVMIPPHTAHKAAL